MNVGERSELWGTPEFIICLADGIIHLVQLVICYQLDKKKAFNQSGMGPKTDHINTAEYIFDTSLPIVVVKQSMTIVGNTITMLPIYGCP